VTASEENDEVERGPLEEALDLFLYAPIGMALTAAEELPEMIRRGREAVEGQVGTARVIGRVAVNQGKVEVNRIVSQWNDLGTLMRSGVLGGTKSEPSAPESKHEPTPEPNRPAPASSAAPPSVPPPSVPPTAKRMPPPPDNLGIAGYSSLSASQVVSRLAGLSAEQLEAVKEYESSTRRRRTVMNRVDQLQSGSEG